MNNTELLKKFKIKSCFAYHEERPSEKEATFGWIPLDKASLEVPCIVSYGSKSKSISEVDSKWSKEAGVNAASLSDYLKYFKSLTGDSPRDFLQKWDDSAEELEGARQASNSKYREGEGAFLLGLARLLVTGGKFSQYGRIFKLISNNT